MRNREDSEFGGGFEVDHVVRESPYPEATHRQFGGQARHPLAGARQVENVAGILAFVTRFVFEPNARIHRLCSAASTSPSSSLSAGFRPRTRLVCRAASRALELAHSQPSPIAEPVAEGGPCCEAVERAARPRAVPERQCSEAGRARSLGLGRALRGRLQRHTHNGRGYTLYAVLGIFSKL